MIEVKENYIDVTEEWINNENIRKGRVINRSYYIDKEGNKYRVDGKNVVLDYSVKEKEVAEWLITKLGGDVYMLPRVNKPDGIMTADYLYKKEYWDLKEIIGNGKRTIDTSIKKKKNQSQNFIIDVSNSKITDIEVFKQIEKIYINRKWINKVIVKRNEKVLFIYIKRD